MERAIISLIVIMVTFLVIIEVFNTICEVAG